MSIFGIILLALLLAGVIFAVGIFIFGVINEWDDLSRGQMIALIIISGTIWIGGIFIGIGLNTESDRIFIAKYNAQKYTIEQSLKSDVLSGLERVQLVNQAAELNGELSERKTMYERWHHVCYDNTIYDDAEFITLGEE